ncbi:MAG TPA: hypothetical protein IAB38_00845 [Candidatus Onthousia excrementipullorum]|uniref:Uncharacterized protein n=1 Tax=Candidatus Onthousia excrementipullorum TaxID=2840884 RepID=A0A9D1DT20_9FIRM|nr:hypothetical protein [Candidatus Onthousia excrementipullorum]
MDKEIKKTSSKVEDTTIDLEKLEELIISYTQEIIDAHEYAEILKEKDNKKEEEITKIYKLK